MVGRKVVTEDGSWSRGWVPLGIFVEGKETKSYNLVDRLAKRKVLSGVEQSGLLSARRGGADALKVEADSCPTAEKLGFCLSSRAPSPRTGRRSRPTPSRSSSSGHSSSSQASTALTAVHYASTAVFFAAGALRRRVRHQEPAGGRLRWRSLVA